jgi:cytochrome P450
MNIPKLIAGDAAEFARSPHHFTATHAQKNKGFGRFRLYHRSAVSISDPELTREILIRQSGVFTRSRAAHVLRIALGDGLLTTDNELWHPARHWLDSSFKRDHVQSFIPKITTIITSELDDLEHQIGRDGIELEMLPFLESLVAKLTSSILYGSEWDLKERSEFQHLVSSSVIKAAAILRRPWLIPPWVPGSPGAELRRTGFKLDKLLSPILMNKAHSNANSGLIRDAIRNQDRPGCPLSKYRLLSELKTLAVAAFETTTTTLLWTLDLLARHPEEREQVIAELDEILAGAVPDCRKLSQLRYCQSALLESMRMWPAVYNMVRESAESTTICGHKLGAKTLVYISIYGLHRNPNLWQSPDIFQPSRFDDHSVSHTGYMPFAIGPHNCLGRHIAMIQIQCVIAMLLQRFHITSFDTDPPEAASVFTLRPKSCPRLYITPR